jgi:hypothetical protein
MCTGSLIDTADSDSHYFLLQNCTPPPPLERGGKIRTGDTSSDMSSLNSCSLAVDES